MMWMKWPLMTRERERERERERDPGFTLCGLGLVSLAEKGLQQQGQQ